MGQQGDGQAQAGRLSDRLADDRTGANVRVYLDVPLSRTELGVARPEPVLRVHVRFPDRAGVTLAVLDSLREMLPNLAPDGHGPVNWQVWYARVQISEGNTGLIMLTARLAVDPQVAERWRQSVFEDLARQVRGRTMSKAAGQRGQTDSGFRAPEDTALILRLITMPRSNGSSGRGHEGAPDNPAG